METKNVAIISIWAFMIAYLILSFWKSSVGNWDFSLVYFLFFIALIVTVYLASGKNERNYNSHDKIK
jgi:hypothetical protein